jgi:hypothetical protein
MILEIRNWSIEFIRDRIGSHKSSLLIWGNNDWLIKKTFVFYNRKKYMGSDWKKYKSIRYLSFPEFLNINFIMIDVNKYGIPFMFHVLRDTKNV